MDHHRSGRDRNTLTPQGHTRPTAIQHSTRFSRMATHMPYDFSLELFQLRPTPGTRNRPATMYDRIPAKDGGRLEPVQFVASGLSTERPISSRNDSSRILISRSNPEVIDVRQRCPESPIADEQMLCCSLRPTFFSHTMPQIDLETSAGPASFAYTISTPTVTSATQIVQGIPTVILIHSVYVNSCLFHRTFARAFPGVRGVLTSGSCLC
jgi:hypothetical protein